MESVAKLNLHNFKSRLRLPSG